MPIHRRLSLVSALAVAAILPASRVHADSFNWANSTYSDNSAQPTAQTAAGSSAGGNAISVQFSTGSYFATPANNASTTPGSPAVGTYAAQANANANPPTSPIYANGGSTGFRALQILADFDNSAGTIIAGAQISVTVFFSQPVSNLIFSFYDVDNGTVNGAPYNDLITNIVATSVNNTTIRPVAMANGADNNYTLGANVSNFTATANNAQNAPGGNATVNFGNTAINQFTFTYTDTAVNSGAAHSTLQIISLGDMQFTTVPEPSTWACFAAAGGLGVWTLRRRARRTA